jgi:DNA-binding GntR family transcriptional regulator
MKAVTKTDAVFEELRREIYAGELKTGQPLLVRDLTERLGFSPTPIREALRLLQAAGLVTHQQHHMMVVRTASVAQDEDIFALRLELEPLAAAKAAERATAAQRLSIGRHRDRMLKLAAAPVGDQRHLEELRSTQLDMMHSIHEAAASPLLLEFIDRLWSSLPAGRPWCQWEELVDDQSDLVDAILEADSDQAAQRMSRYLSNARKVELQVANKMSPPATPEPS